MKFSAHEKHLEAERELGMRKRFYPHKVESGAMSNAVARRRIELMQEIADDYEILAIKERML